MFATVERDTVEYRPMKVRMNKVFSPVLQTLGCKWSDLERAYVVPQHQESFIRHFATTLEEAGWPVEVRY